MPEFTLQEYLTNGVKNKLVYEAGGSLLVLDKTTMTATHTDHNGNVVNTFAANDPANYYVSYQNEGSNSPLQKNTIKIITKEGTQATTHISLTDPTEAFY